MKGLSMKNELTIKNTGFDEVKKIEEQTNKKIKEGLENPKASTGTLISELSGGAKFMAQLSNIGDGSIATGGNGIAGGFNTIMQNQQAKAALITAEQLNQKEKGNKKISSKK